MSEPVRDTQLSLVEGMERPVGSIPLSVQTGTNADLMATVAPIYLTGSVLDVTYGRGKWWDRFTPEPFTYHDLNTVDGVDFRDLPHADRSFDTVCFDPPYIPAGGKATNDSGSDFRDRFGLATGVSMSDMAAMMVDGLAECARVADRYLLAKCSDFVTSGKFTLGHRVILDAADDLGLTIHDLIVHFAGSGPGNHNIKTIKRARRAHSYLLVFAVPKVSKSSEAVRPASDDAPAGPFLPAGAAVDGGSQPVIPAGDAAHAQGRGVPAINSIARNGTDNGSSVTCGFAGGAVPDGSFTASGSSPRRESQPQQGETGGPRMVPTASTSPEENR